MPKILPIRILGDDILRRKLKEADPKDPFLKSYLPDLIHTMYERDGVGLASNQVGVDLRIFAIDPWWGREGNKRKPIVLINPVIHHMEGDQLYEEGCISLPDIYANVPRAQKIKYSYTTPNGDHVEAEAEGYEAVVIQHEYDHLDGIVFTDKISTLAKLKLKRKLRDIEATAKDGVNIRIYEDE
ncbi:MAG: peptide deformylase [Candidatus Cloacimonetes bacterium]|jgi:peptide deformylase|nr:peptide deformylase [Candidatus Cloacimonadota bacterium]MDD2505804.1 peptide deformylase [Candidatus Cloacimonadota bacterium]MDD4147615.1 peptide deformylase [Candidatus Cloacimonadota bacterium]MDD4559226.1 peptide deformylase [Candidatus Cloacimonadota bacterium]